SSPSCSLRNSGPPSGPCADPGPGLRQLCPQTHPEGGFLVTATAESSQRTDAKPTIVLVHGAFADGSSWNGVIERLQHQGDSVIAPGVPLRGGAAASAYLASVVNQLDGPVLLVGHSYAGALITNAATDAAHVVGLVFVAAFAPDTDERLGDVAATSKDRLLATAQVQSAYPPRTRGG